MADYADTALSPSRPERSAPSKRRATSDFSDFPAETHDAAAPDVDAGIAARDALAATAAAKAAADSASEPAVPDSTHGEPGAPDAPIGQGTLSGFEMPEGESALADEASAAPARRAARKDAMSMDPDAGSADTEPARVEPVLFPAASSDASKAAGVSKVAEPASLASRIDALHAALADQQRLAAASARRLKWTLAAATAAVVATLGFGIAQSARFDSFANESRAETARLEQLVLSQQSALEGVSQRLAAQAAAAQAAAAVAAEAPVARPAAARAAPATAPAPATRRAARAAREAHETHAARPARAHHAQKPAH